MQIKTVRIIFVYKPIFPMKKLSFFSRNFFSSRSLVRYCPKLSNCKKKPGKSSIHYDAMCFAPAGGFSSRLPSPEDMTSSPTRRSPTAINGK